MIEYREMLSEEISRIGEVNREEMIEAEYVTEPDTSGLGVVTRMVRLEPPKGSPPWGKVGTEKRINDWRPPLDQGGCMYGAFHSTRLVGFVILGPVRRDCSAEIVSLFIDRDFRRKGIGSEFINWVLKRSQSMGIGALFLYSNPTESAVGFYLDRGFQIMGLISKHIVRDLPGDILMEKRIQKGKQTNNRR